MKTLITFLAVSILAVNVNPCQGRSNSKDLQDVQKYLNQQQKTQDRNPAKDVPIEMKLSEIIEQRKDEAWEAMQTMNEEEFKQFVQNQVEDK